MNLRSQDSTANLRLATTQTVPPSCTQADLESVVLHLFDQFQARLATYVVAFGLPHHDAEDIVQETFLSLFSHLQRDRPRWNLNGWIFRVAHNLALKRRTANQSAHHHPDGEALLARHPDPAHNAEEQFGFHQTQQRLRAVFEALPEVDRRCLHLRAEGLKYREIAQTLGISLGSVSLSISRSLTRMNRATEGSL